MAAKEQPRWQLPLLQFATLMLLTILVVALGSFARTMLDNYRLRAERETWEGRITQEEAEHERLLAQRDFVASEAYQRQLAHEMGLYAPAERPLVLVLPPEMQEELDDFDPVYREAEILVPPYWRQWWELFFGSGPPPP